MNPPLRLKLVRSPVDIGPWFFGFHRTGMWIGLRAPKRCSILTVCFTLRSPTRR